MADVQVEEKEMMIPLSKIRPPSFNSRLDANVDEEKIASLQASMSAEGQLNAINVEGPFEDGNYELVAGSRRCRAAHRLKWNEIRARVRPPTSPETRIIKNIVENQQREDLTTYEQARAVNELRNVYKMSLKAIGEKTGLSVPYVSNLSVTYGALPSLVKTEWEKENPAATFTFLRSLASLKGETPEATAEKMVLAFKEREDLHKSFDKKLEAPSDDAEATDDADAMSDDTDDGDGKDLKRKPAKPYKVDRKVYQALRKAIEKARLPGTPLALQAMEVLIGTREKIKGLYPLPETK